MKYFGGIKKKMFLLVGLLCCLGFATVEAFPNIMGDAVDAVKIGAIKAQHGRVQGLKPYHQESDAVKKAIVDKIVEMTSWGDAKNARVERPINIWALKGRRGENNPIYVRIGTSQSDPMGTEWRKLPGGTTSKVAAGPNGEAWLLDNDDTLWFVTAGQENRTGRWFQIDTGIKDIAVGADGTVWCLASGKGGTAYHVYQRVGTSEENPVGTTWKQIGGHDTVRSQISVNPWGGCLGINYHGGRHGSLWYLSKNGDQKRIGDEEDFHHVSAGAFGDIWAVRKGSRRDGNYPVSYRWGVNKQNPIGNNCEFTAGTTAQVEGGRHGEAWYRDAGDGGMLWYVPPKQGKNSGAWVKIGTGWADISVNAVGGEGLAEAPDTASVAAPVTDPLALAKEYKEFIRGYDWAVAKWEWKDTGYVERAQGFFDKHKDTLKKNFAAVKQAVEENVDFVWIHPKIPNAAKWMQFWGVSQFINPVQLFEKLAARFGIVAPALSAEEEKKLQELFDKEKLEIVTAFYGDLNITSDTRRKNVTAKVKELIRADEIVFGPESKNKYFGDPAKDVSKGLMVVYKMGDQYFFNISNEYEAVTIPRTTDFRFSASEIKDEPRHGLPIRVLKALYGDLNLKDKDGSKIADVTEKVDRISFGKESKNEYFGDPAVGIVKGLFIFFEDEGNLYADFSNENVPATFSDETANEIAPAVPVVKRAPLKDYQIYTRVGTSEANPLGIGWNRGAGSTNQVAIGKNGEAWLLDASGLLWFVPAGERENSKKWSKLGTGWTDIAVGGDGTVCALKGGKGGTSYHVFRRIGTSDDNPLGTDWEQIGGNDTVRSQIAVDDWGNIWGVLYHSGETGSMWWIGKDGGQKKIDEDTDYHYVSAGDGRVWCTKGVNGDNYNIWTRSGVSESNPTGTKWNQLSGSTREVEVVRGGHGLLIDRSSLLWFVPAGEGKNTKAWKKLGTGWHDVSGGENGEIWGLQEKSITEVELAQIKNHDFVELYKDALVMFAHAASRAPIADEAEEFANEALGKYVSDAKPKESTRPATAPEPYDHHEVVFAQKGKDARTKNGCNIFSLHSVSKPENIGALEYGEIIEIRAHKAEAGGQETELYEDEERILIATPLTRWATDPTIDAAKQAEAKEQWRDTLLVTRAFLKAIKDKRYEKAAHFKLVSPEGKTGAVTEGDVFHLVSVAHGDEFRLWTHENYRTTWEVSELLAVKGDPWGGEKRFNANSKMHFQIVRESSLDAKGIEEFKDSKGDKEAYVEKRQARIIEEKAKELAEIAALEGKEKQEKLKEEWAKYQEARKAFTQEKQRLQKERRRFKNRKRRKKVKKGKKRKKRKKRRKKAISRF